MMMPKNAFQDHWRWGLGIVLFLMFLAGSGTVTLAQDPDPLAGGLGPIAFLDEEPLTLTLADPAEAPVYVVTLKNNGEEVKDLEFCVVALKNEEGTHVRGSESIDITAQPETLKANDVMTFTLTFPSPNELDLPSPGSYSGFLVVTASEVAPIHKPFTLNVQPSTTSLAELVPKDESVIIPVTNTGWPFFLGWDPHLQISGESQSVELLGTGVNTNTLKVILPVSTRLQTDDGQVITATLGGYTITTSGESLMAKLSLSGVSQPGEYTGDLRFDPLNPDESKKLSITVLVEDHWRWLLVVIVAGLSGSYVVSHWWTRYRPGKDIERRALVTLAEIKKDWEDFRKEWDNTGLRKYTLVGSLRMRVEHAQARLDRTIEPEPRQEQQTFIGSLRWRVRCFQARVARITQLHKVKQTLDELLKEFEGLKKDANTQVPNAQKASVRVGGIINSIKDDNLDAAKAKLTKLLSDLRRLSGYWTSSAIKEIWAVLVLMRISKKEEALSKLNEIKGHLHDFEQDKEDAETAISLVKEAGKLLVGSEGPENVASKAAKAKLGELLDAIGGPSFGTAEKEVEGIQDLVAQGKLEKAEEKLDALLAYFEGYQTFRSSSVDLHTAYTQVQNLEGPNESRPRLEDVMKGLFPGQAVKGAKDLEGLTAQVQGLLEFYAIFMRLYGRLKLGESILEQLNPDRWTWNAHETELLGRLKATVDGAKTDLWWAGTIDELSRWRVEAKLEWALGRLRELKEKHPPPQPAKVLALDEVSEEPALVLERIIPGLLDLTRATPDELKKEALRIGRFLHWGDLIFIIFGWLVAVATAMLALYGGQTFGNSWEYLTAFIWGAGVDQSLKGLRAVLSKLGITGTA